MCWGYRMTALKMPTFSLHRAPVKIISVLMFVTFNCFSDLIYIKTKYVWLCFFGGLSYSSSFFFTASWVQSLIEGNWLSSLVYFPNFLWNFLCKKVLCALEHLRNNVFNLIIFIIEITWHVALGKRTLLYTSKLPEPWNQARNRTPRRDEETEIKRKSS